MNRVRSFITIPMQARPILSKLKPPIKHHKVEHHDDGPPQPFDNMPFSIPNRYAATAFFCVFFGTGLWAPYMIVWYQMAKRAL